MKFSKLIILKTALTLSIVTALFTPASVYANSDPMMGEIQVVGFNFCPRGWLEANGQILSINQNQALFSLLGTTFGGDGRTTFALPDYRGRTSIGYGDSPSGAGTIAWGEKGGRESFPNTFLPSHSHTATTVTTIHASSQSANESSPTNAVLADDGRDNIYNSELPNVNLSSATISSITDVSVAPNALIANMQPYLVMNVCIATEGLFPSRN